jgi:hypothetical protein
MFENLTRRRVALPGRAWRFDLHGDGEKFAELRPIGNQWKIAARYTEVAQCVHRRLAALPLGSDETQALAAVRKGIEDLIGYEDDVDETYSDRTLALMQEYRVLRLNFDLDVDSDCVDTLRPTVDRLRVVERELHLLPYVIGGAVYNG